MIIQKFGGVAMKNEEMRLNCINHIKDGLKSLAKLSLSFLQLAAMVILIRRTAFYSSRMPFHLQQPQATLQRLVVNSLRQQYYLQN